MYAQSLIDQPAISQQPAVTSLSPPAGPAQGGTTVTIAGSGFTGATAVKFGSTSATAFTVVSDSQITATSPRGLGKVDVTVTTPGGTSATSTADQFTYELDLVVTTLTDKLDKSYNPANLSLREALSLTNMNAGGDNTISFDQSLDGGTISLSLGELPITDSVGIEGLGSNITIDAGGQSRIFNVDDGDSSSLSNVDIVGLTLTGGNADDGGAIYSIEYLALGFANVTGNTASDKGGGVYALTPGMTVLQNCTVSGNTAAGDGGGIYVSTSFGTSIQGCTISGNTAGQDGGGIYSATTENGMDITIQDSTISNNSAVDGGGLFSTGVGNTVIQGSTISANTVTGDGAGLYVNTGNGLTLQTSTVSGNSAVSSAGAYNGTTRGGGIYLSMSNYWTDIEQCTISGNYAVDGGGIFAMTSSLASTIVHTVQESTISGNTAGWGGGLVLLNYNGGATTVQNSTIAENSASYGGGGIFAGGIYGTATVQNSTITGNTADANGAGKGGGICSYSYNGTVTLTSTIVAQNVDNSGAAPDVAGSVGLTTSLIGDNTGSGLPEHPVGAPDNSGNMIGGPVHGVINARLGPLSDNGGPTETSPCTWAARPSTRAPIPPIFPPISAAAAFPASRERGPI